MNKKGSSRFLSTVGILTVFTALFVITGCGDPEPVQKVFENADGTTTIISEESGIGFMSTTGTMKTHDSYPGYEENFIDTLGIRSNVVYSFNVPAACEAKIKVRYAFWGTTTEVRVGRIIINGQEDDEWIYFPWTSKTGSNIWQDSAQITVQLNAGSNQIRLHPVAEGVEAPGATFPAGVTVAEPYLSSGKLPNIDSLTITAAGITEGTSDVEYFEVIVESCNDEMGAIAKSPDQDFYIKDTSVTLTATPSAGYIFDSWTAEAKTSSVPSRANAYTFTVTADSTLTGRFIPADAVQPAGLVGYGAIQDDEATAYTLTGGFGGTEYTVSSIDDLDKVLNTENAAYEEKYARIITVSGTLDNWGNPSLSYNVPANTTIQSASSSQGHLRNIELKLAGDNIIIKNMIFSEVVASACEIGGVPVAVGKGNDALQINGARHIWIDHCEFYSSLEFPEGVTSTVAAKDFYDGLLDMKNGSSFITVSNSYFRDHWKAILCGSGDDDDNGDSEMRLTFHNNYFKNVNSRSPLLRYGKAHLFNNYWNGDGQQIDSTVNARCGSEVFVENNYFNNCKYSIGFFYSTDAATTGKWNVSGNIFSSAPSVSSTTSWTPPYEYTASEDVSGLVDSVPSSVGPKFRQ